MVGKKREHGQRMAGSKQTNKKHIGDTWRGRRKKSKKRKKEKKRERKRSVPMTVLTQDRGFNNPLLLNAES